MLGCTIPLHLLSLSLTHTHTPQKSWLGLGVLAGGYTLVGSFFYWLYRHSLDLLASMWQYIIIYVLISAIVSFAIIYRLGPVENPRTFNLIQWSIQLLALVLIGLASQLPEAGLVFVAMAMLSYLIPARYVHIQRTGYVYSMSPYTM